MDALELVWEQELYNEIDYKRKEPLFHCFEGDTAFVGLSFMDEMEANHFHEKVAERIRKRRERAEAAERASRLDSFAVAPEVRVSKPSNTSQRGSGNQKQKEQKTLKKEKSESSWRPWKKKEKKKKRSKIDRTMIGAPDETTFVHVSGQNVRASGGGKEPDKLDPRLKKLFALANFDDYLENPEKIQQFQKWAEETNLYEQIEEIEKVERTSANKPVKALPTSGGAPPPPPPGAPPPPPAPSGQSPSPMFIKRQSNSLGESNSHGGSGSFLNDIRAREGKGMEGLKRVESVKPLKPKAQAMDDLLKDAFTRFETGMGRSGNRSDSGSSESEIGDDYDSDEWSD